MAAELEEVIVTPDPLDAEQLFPDRRQQRLDRAARRLVAPTRIGIVVRGRQRFAVELAVRRQRQHIQPHEDGRYHVVGQQATEMGPQRRGELGAIRFGRSHLGPTHDIGDKPLVAGAIVPRHHRRIGDERVLAEPGGDLARLDAEAADLHLVVVAAQELEIAIRQVAGQVAGPVETVAFDKGTGDEPLRRQLRPVKVAARHACPADIELAHRPERNGHTMNVQKIDDRIANWPSHRHPLPIEPSWYRKAETEGGILCRTVAIRDQQRGISLLTCFDGIGRDLFAPDQQLL